MDTDLVGMFDSRDAAEAARRQLVDAGFSSASVTMAGGSETASDTVSTDGTSSNRAPDMDEMAPQHEGAIARFFRGLFGSDDDEARTSGAYHEAFRRGSYGVRVTVDDDAQMQRAERILNDAGAVDIDERAQQWRSEGWSGGSTAGRTSDDGLAGDATATGATMAGGTMAGSTLAGATPTDLSSSSGRSPSDTTADRGVGDRATAGTAARLMAGGAQAAVAGATQTLKEVEEQLQVGKREVARGGVRIHRRVTETPVQESVTLREEHADVQRRAVDREATEADLAAFEEGTLEVREMSEEAVVAKTARVVGEVEVGKRVSERQETINDTVRKTKVEVEQLEPSTTGKTTSTGSTSTTPIPGSSDRKPV